MNEELPGLHELLAGLPRTKVTPENITQVMIDRWYETERKRIEEIQQLRQQIEDERERARLAEQDEFNFEGRAKRAEADLEEMTRLRDNALRQAEHADQSIDVDLEGIVGDGLTALGWEWDNEIPDVPPSTLIEVIVDLVRPVVAHATKRAEAAEEQLPQCNGRCLRIDDVLSPEDLGSTRVVGDPIARAHRSCPLHGDPERVAWELDAALKEAQEELTAALVLLKLAHHIRMYGEYAPGGTENWGDWDREAEQFLREGS